MTAKKIPIEEGLFDMPETPDGDFYLLGNKCSHCGRYFFPKVERCLYCPSKKLTDKKIGRSGKIYTFTNCNYPPPGQKYKGAIPYGLGLIALDEGIIIPSRIAENDPRKLSAGMPVALFCEKLYEDDDGNEIVCFSYRVI